MTPIEKRDFFIKKAEPLLEQLQQVTNEIGNNSRSGFRYVFATVSGTDKAEIITNWCGKDGGHLIITLASSGHFKADLANGGNGQERLFIEGHVTCPEAVRTVGSAIKMHWKNGHYRPC